MCRGGRIRFFWKSKSTITLTYISLVIYDTSYYGGIKTHYNGKDTKTFSHFAIPTKFSNLYSLKSWITKCPLWHDNVIIIFYIIYLFKKKRERTVQKLPFGIHHWNKLSYIILIVLKFHSLCVVYYYTENKPKLSKHFLWKTVFILYIVFDLSFYLIKRKKAYIYCSV